MQEGDGVAANARMILAANARMGNAFGILCPTVACYPGFIRGLLFCKACGLSACFEVLTYWYIATVFQGYWLIHSGLIFLYFPLMESTKDQ